MTTYLKYTGIDFLTHIIKQCPDNCVAELQCNWTNVSYTNKESDQISKYFSIENCKSNREVEVFKSSRFENYKYKDAKFGQYEVWLGGLNLFITNNNKTEIIGNIKEYLDDSDVCHCQIYMKNKQLAECYDSFMHNKLDNTTFKFTDVEIKNYGKNNVDINLY